MLHITTPANDQAPKSVKLSVGGRWHRPKIDVFKNGEHVVTACNVVGQVVRVSTDSRIDCHRCAGRSK